MRTAIVSYMSGLGIQKNVQSQSIGEAEFVDFANRICQFVNIKPAEHVLKACFKSSSRGSSSLSQS